MFKKLVFFILIVITFAIIWQCNFVNDVNSNTEAPIYLNHSDSIKYIGMAKCLECHADKISFLETGMGKSFGVANAQKSIINSITNTAYIDSFGDFKYRAYLKNNQLYLCEEKFLNKTSLQTIERKVDYVVGSGQHTNSHIVNKNGYLYQMPFTFYRQKALMDFPPGFEGGYNTRFSRKIGLECMTCHNAYPSFVLGSENKYIKVPDGIDCERCHGPGEAHLNQFIAGKRVDTSIAIDYSIVNPAKLSIERQFDICQRCHLQGNAVLNEGKSFFDFKPGKKLEEVMTVFLPRFSNADDEFIMASHADRLKLSKCFIVSLKKADGNKSIRPYKQALTCVTCHNPHVSVSKMDDDYFNKKCMSCHKDLKHRQETFFAKNNPNKFLENNCIGCHMPKSGSIDIPHVSIHDHYIRKPVLKDDVNKIKSFIGLQAINNKRVDLKTKLIAYLQQYEKFEPKLYYLDSLELLLKTSLNDGELFRERIWFSFLKNDFETVVGLAQKENLISKLNKVSFDNYDAWTLYRIGESFAKLNYVSGSLPYFEKATKLAPFNLEFKQKLANANFNLKNINKAIALFLEILKEDDEFVGALNGLGFVYLSINNVQQASFWLKKALYLDPNNEIVILNNISLQFRLNNKTEIKKLLKRLQKINPHHPKLKALMELV